MIEPHAFVGWPAVALIIPKRPERAMGLQLSQSISPAEGKQSRKRLPTRRLNKSVAIQRPRWINIVNGRHDVVIASQYDGHTCSMSSSAWVIKRSNQASL